MDADETAENLRVVAAGSGIYDCFFTPSIHGPAELSMSVAGAAVSGTPHQVDILPPPLRFKWLSRS